eukprot:TRINITY_DN9098_c0_g1_i1.p1 TRINITY_DN9098_c0_g1~~TRINITY_DN9098_c0_g1_i1.p1  ORF type:complete len:112 (-),score=5.47 TRINITY_DN9098_c0_g1_i1:733-1068(-)
MHQILGGKDLPDRPRAVGCMVKLACFVYCNLITIHTNAECLEMLQTKRGDSGAVIVGILRGPSVLGASDCNVVIKLDSVATSGVVRSGAAEIDDDLLSLAGVLDGIRKIAI